MAIGPQRESKHKMGSLEGCAVKAGPDGMRFRLRSSFMPEIRRRRGGLAHEKAPTLSVSKGEGG
ncbi:hypothetical protein BJ928_1011351 [Rhizobium sp. WW_1]|nr:hypothetical protein BJ928_1011351 [Rhizobium sp. WW_1]